MAKVHLAKATIEDITSTDRNQTFTDDQTRGLTLIVTPNGVKTFYLTRKFKSRVERTKLGRFPETTLAIARERAAKLHLQYDAGVNVAATARREREELTLDAFFELYYRDHCLLRNRKPKVVRYHYERYLRPMWGRNQLSQIKRADVAEYHRQIGREGKTRTANKAVGLLRAIFNKALAWEYFDAVNPAQYIERFREQSRDRFLEASELSRFHVALAKEEVIYQDFFLMLAYTGARKSELLAMRWGDVSIEDQRWRIPDSKTGEPRRVMLARPAIAILQRRFEQRHFTDAWVFPGRESPDKHLVEVKRAWDRVLTRAGIENLWIHDLRRTNGSWMLDGGADVVTIGRALGHKDIASTLVYARSGGDAQRRHVEKTALRLSPPLRTIAKKA